METSAISHTNWLHSAPLILTGNAAIAMKNTCNHNKVVILLEIMDDEHKAVVPKSHRFTSGKCACAMHKGGLQSVMLTVVDSFSHFAHFVALDHPI